MEYRDLNARPKDSLRATVERMREEARSSKTGPTGVKDFGEHGDAVWTDGDGQQQSVRTIPSALERLQEELVTGIATASKFNTVATSTPAETDGYPEGAFWTIVELGPPMVETDRWQLVDGAWVQVGLDAGRLVAGTVDAGLIDAVALAARMVTAGLIRTAESGQRVVIDSTGITLYGINDDGAEYEMVRIGPSGDNLITAGSTMISPSGVQAPAGSFDSLAVGGDTLGDILAQYPRGMRAWGQLTSTSQLDGDTSDYARRGEIQTTLEAGRLYRIRLSEHFVEVTGGTNTNIVEELRYSFDGTPILHGTTPNEGTYRGIFARNPVFAGSATAVNGMEFMLDTGSWSSGRGFWLMWMIRPEVAGRPVRVLATSFYSPVLSIEDVGPSMPSTLKRWNDGDGGGGATEPADPTPIVVRRTQTWDAASYGGDTRNGTVYQGTYSSYGNRYGGWVFYPAMRSALAGSTIEKFEVYLENAHWYYGSGGTAVLYPNDGTYKGILGSGTTSANWPRYAGRWVTVPSSWHTQIANGTYKGVSVYTTNTGLTYYGQFKGSPTKFRVTYRK
ncbi:MULTISPECIES: hypothetical protein [Brachybacterium]|uniref:hypothetical protein n=1 Tax=Brachybacterium TaxID=43668 RepID=UPI00026C7012|nr:MULTISPECIES: hypothetical protein [Brachybacterium]OFT48839.1 hypothetical protein HMPREF3159_13020 [Brachybacterium sp. HMSC06H03]